MDIAEVLRQHGYKVTPQRLAVYAVIEHNPAHPNAEAMLTCAPPIIRLERPLTLGHGSYSYICCKTYQTPQAE